MSRASLLIVLGVLIAFLPWSGFPITWAVYALPIGGILVAAIGWSLRSRHDRGAIERVEAPQREIEIDRPSRAIDPSGEPPTSVSNDIDFPSAGSVVDAPPAAVSVHVAPIPQRKAAAIRSRPVRPTAVEAPVAVPAVPLQPEVSTESSEVPVTPAAANEESLEKPQRPRRTRSVVPPSRTSRIAKF